MSRRKRWADSTFQKLPLEVLSIEALNRVLDIRSEYDLGFQGHEGRRAQNEAEKKSLITALSSATQQTNDLQRQIFQLNEEVAPFKVGAITKWLFSEPTIEFRGINYGPLAKPYLDKLDLGWKRYKESNDLQSSLQKRLHNFVGKPEFPPKREARLRYQSQTFVFDISLIDPERVKRIIEKKKNKAALEQEQERSKHERVQTKLGQTKAKAAAYENKQRELAKSVRAALRKELRDNPYCPYCNNELSTKGAHADHIHPVTNGGLSTIGNMVFVCGSCNVAKGTLTLRAFIKKMDFVGAEVYERLELMRKDV
jgi:5-methylcytosine-specific restriction endonuclease McrA